MKLTKGKILKAHKKNKQTMKKYKKVPNKNTNSKSKTFRKGKSNNLLNSTLKNYGMLGGASGNENSGNESGDIELQPMGQQITSSPSSKPNFNAVPPADATQDEKSIGEMLTFHDSSSYEPNAESVTQPAPEPIVEETPPKPSVPILNEDEEEDLNYDEDEYEDEDEDEDDDVEENNNMNENEKVIEALEILTNYILTRYHERTGGTGTLNSMINTWQQPNAEGAGGEPEPEVQQLTEPVAVAEPEPALEQQRETQTLG